MSEDFVSLANLGDGAASERFDIELRRVIENIMDTNTKATAKREITLKVVMKPDDDRDYSDVEIHITSKVAPIRPYPTTVYIGIHKGEPVAKEHNPKQTTTKEAIQQAKAAREDGKVLDITNRTAEGE